MSEPQATPAASPSTGIARRWTYVVLILAVLFVVMPFLFWQSTWFGKPLSDDELAKAFADEQHPRKIQHALSQITDRILRGDPSVSRWYPEVIRVSGHSVDEIRVTAAWVMGQDNKSPEFHEALRGLLDDANPMVARNAALSLVRFNDAGGRTLLAAMLRTYTVASPAAGTLAQRLKIGDMVNPGTMVARIRAGQEEIEVRTPVPGTVHEWQLGDGLAVEQGTPLVAIAPSPEMVWEALRGLYLIGEPEDLAAVERYAAGVTGMPDSISQQARLTAEAIRKRAGA